MVLKDLVLNVMSLNIYICIFYDKNIYKKCCIGLVRKNNMMFSSDV